MASDMTGEVFIHFSVAGNGLPLASRGIPVNVMACAGSEQAAAVFLQIAKQLAPLHTAISLTA